MIVSNLGNHNLDSSIAPIDALAEVVDPAWDVASPWWSIAAYIAAAIVKARQGAPWGAA